MRHKFIHAFDFDNKSKRTLPPTSKQFPATSSSALLQAFMKFLFSYTVYPVCIQKEEYIVLNWFEVLYFVYKS